MNIRKLLKHPNLPVLLLALTILGGITLFSPSAQQVTTPDASKSVAKLFKQKPPKKQSTQAPVAQALLTPSPSQTATLPVIHKSGTLTTNETWTAGNVYMIDNTITIPDGITLTIDQGVIIKSSTRMFKVEAGGVLSAFGTATDPVFFTSVNDDSVGGDSNNDGTSTTAMQGDYNRVVTPAGGDISIGYAAFLYGTYSVAVDYGCYMPTGNVAVEDSEIRAGMNLGWCALDSLRLARNDFIVTGGIAIWTPPGIDPGSILLSGSDSNVFLGDDTGRVINLGSPNISTTCTWSIDGSCRAVVVVSDMQVAGTFTLSNGAILKNQNSTAITVNSGGTFNAIGTGASKVVLTSYKDDSSGGDSTGDGVTSGSNQDGGILLKNNGGVINISHAKLRNAFSGLKVEQAGSVSIQDSEINVCIQPKWLPVILQRNLFDIPLVGGTACAIDAEGSLDISGIKLAGSETNVFNGGGFSRAVYVSDADVPSNKTWSVSGDSRAVLMSSNVEVYGVMEMGEGAIVKGVNGRAISVQPEGSMNVAGSVASPVRFTSSNDDAVGGDTTADGLTYGSPGDHGAAIHVSAGASVDITHAQFTFSAIAVQSYGDLSGDKLNVMSIGLGFGIYGGTAELVNSNISGVDSGLVVENSKVIFRGVFNSVANKAIQACNWTSANCSVDASYSDWGSAGPTTSLVWAGYSSPMEERLHNG